MAIPWFATRALWSVSLATVLLATGGCTSAGAQPTPQTGTPADTDPIDVDATGAESSDSKAPLPKRAAPNDDPAAPLQDCRGCEPEEGACVRPPTHADCEPDDPNDPCEQSRLCEERCCLGLEDAATDE